MVKREDPGNRNKLFNSDSVFNYLTGYADEMREALRKVDPQGLEKAFDVLKAAMEKQNSVYVAGNGGSAAISDHLCCDWTKGSWNGTALRLKSQSLVANGAMLTAVANDFGYEDVFAAQIEMLADSGAVVVLISSSGNSPNVIRAVQAAKKINATVIGLTGFGGGELRKLADISLHVDVNNYGIVEDCHQVLMHVLSQRLGIWARAKAETFVTHK